MAHKKYVLCTYNTLEGHLPLLFLYKKKRNGLDNNVLLKKINSKESTILVYIIMFCRKKDQLGGKHYFGLYSNVS